MNNDGIHVFDNDICLALSEAFHRFGYGIKRSDSAKRLASGSLEIVNLKELDMMNPSLTYLYAQ